MISGRASFLFKLKRSTLHFHLLPLSFAKPKTQPLKFNKCSSFPEERERTDERANPPTSYLHYVRDATDFAARGTGTANGGAERGGGEPPQEWGIARRSFGPARGTSAALVILVSPATA